MPLADDSDDDDKQQTDPQLQAILDRVPGARVVQPGDELPTMPPNAPNEDPAGVAAQREGLEEMRRGMTPAERLAKADECKRQANEHFGNGKWRVSMVGYVAGIFFLKHGEPRCPLLVASEVRGLDEVSDALGAGTSGGGGGGGDGTTATGVATPEEAEGAMPMRVACHLNLAAAALKLQEWTIARAACEYVLTSVDAAHPKALFRLAKAYEGAGEVGPATSTVAKLLKHDAANAEARKLHEALKKRSAKERSAFKNMFERAREEAGGDGLYTAAEEQRDEKERVKKLLGGQEAPEGSKVLSGAQIANMSEEERQQLVDQINGALDE